MKIKQITSPSSVFTLPVLALPLLLAQLALGQTEGGVGIASRSNLLTQTFRTIDPINRTGQAKPDYTFTTFDPPGSTSTNQLGGGINDAGWIVGSYDDVNGITHGYLLRDGKYTQPLDFPDAILTRVNGINDLGQIVGHYRDAGDIQHGFLLSDGKYWTIDFPGAENGTVARGINASGLIVGGYDLAPGMIFSHGFLRMVDGTYETIDFPGAVFSQAQDINDPGDIVGRYDDADGIRHGYLLRREGGYTTLDHPDSSTLTAAFGINDFGQIVGRYIDADRIPHGFLLSEGRYNTLDPPGSTDVTAWKINDCGLILGTYRDAGGSYHGFLATPNDNNWGSKLCNEK